MAVKYWSSSSYKGKEKMCQWMKKGEKYLKHTKNMKRMRIEEY